MTSIDDKTEKAMAWIDGQADLYFVELGLTEHIKNMTNVMRLNPTAPREVRERFINRVERLMYEMSRQVFLEAWMKGYYSKQDIKSLGNKP